MKKNVRSEGVNSYAPRLIKFILSQIPAPIAIILDRKFSDVFGMQHWYMFLSSQIGKVSLVATLISRSFTGFAYLGFPLRRQFPSVDNQWHSTCV